MSIKCSFCQGENTKKLSIIYASGLSTSQRTAYGAVGGRLGFGISRGTQQTVLSEIAGPPEFKGGHKFGLIALSILLLIVSILVIVIFDEASSFAMFCFVSSIISFLFSQTKFVATWDAVQQEVQDDYYKSYMCLSCGSKFIHDDEQLQSDLSI